MIGRGLQLHQLRHELVVKFSHVTRAKNLPSLNKETETFVQEGFDLNRIHTVMRKFRFNTKASKTFLSGFCVPILS